MMIPDNMWLRVAREHFLEGARWWVEERAPMAIRAEAAAHIQDIVTNGGESIICQIASSIIDGLEEAYPNSVPVVQVGLALEMALSSIKAAALEAASKEAN